MLRLIVLVLLLANGTFFAWSQGLLLRWGSGPVQQSEPQRLAQQIRPEAARIVSAEEARTIEASPNGRPPECLLAGPFEESATPPLRQILLGWPDGSWNIEPAVVPARWIVYMGRYASEDVLNKKKAELRQRSVSFENLSNPTLEPGISLGGYASQAAAQQQLERLSERGVRTARVVQERPELRGLRLQLPVMDDTLRARLDELRPALNGKPLRACR